MHSMELPSGGTAHFNGDFSGVVIFEEVGNDSKRTAVTGEVKIPFADIEKVVLEKLRRNMISKLETMTDNELRKALFGRAW